MTERGIRGGKGRNAQVKAAVTDNEKRIFEALAKSHYGKEPCTLSHLIRRELIILAQKHKLLPKGYEAD